MMMRKLLSLSAVLLCILEQHFSSQEMGRRVVGGTEAAQNDFPFMAYIRENRRRHPCCGGSIISRRHILSAAHCFHTNRPEELTVVVGGYNIREDKNSGVAKELGVIELRPHENYNQTTKLHDIGLLILKEEIGFTSPEIASISLQQETRVIAPISLQQEPRELLGQMVTALGWGLCDLSHVMLTPSNVLRSVSLQVVALSICKEYFPDAIFDLENPTKLCTKTEDRNICMGDSGGPVVFRESDSAEYVQVGVIASTGDGSSGHPPDVHTLIQPHYEWIQGNLE